MKKARHKYVVFNTEFSKKLLKHVTIARDSYFLENDDEVYWSINFFEEVEGRKIRRSMVLKDQLFDFLDTSIASRFSKALAGPVREFTAIEDQLVFSQNQLHFIHIPIPLSEENRKYFFSTEDEKSGLLLCSINILRKNSSPKNYKMLTHYLKNEIRDEYYNYIINSIIFSLAVSENSPLFVDPSDQFILYLDEIRKKIPDLEIVFWRYDDDYDFLQCDYSTNPGFDCDITDRDHDIAKIGTNSEIVDFANIGVIRKNEPHDTPIFSLAYNLGWRSSKFRAVKVGRADIGVMGFFSSYSGGLPGTYDSLIELISHQTSRFSAEKHHLQEAYKVRENLKKLVPLMAIGNETTQRGHDIRDQLNIVSNSLAAVNNIRDYPERADLQKMTNIGVDALDRMKEILSKQLQTFKKSREARRSFELSKFMSDVIENNKTVAGFDEVEILPEFEEDIYIRVQGFYFERVLDNIISNAIYYSKQSIDTEKSINIKAFKVEDRIQIKVYDNGPGFTYEPINQAFEIGETTKPDGYGIGLAIVREIVEEHQGRVTLRNRKAGGACIEIELPAVAR